jgi:integrase
MTGRVTVKNGFWHLVVSYKDGDGQYKQHWKKTDLKERGNKKLAEKQLADEMVAVERQLKEQENKAKKAFTSKPDIEKLRNMPFEQYARKYVDDISSRLTVAVKTSYYSILKVMEEYFTPLKIRLAEVSPDDIVTFYEYLRTQRGVKEITIKHYSNIIRPALRKAYKDRVIEENPYDFVPVIHKEKHRPTFYNKEEMESLFKVIEGHDLELEFKLLAYYGLRRSELLGLKWDAVDYVNKILYIKRTLLCPKKTVVVSEKMKTQSSNRALPLIPEMEQALKARWERIQKDKAYFGSGYKTEYDGFVCVNAEGGIIKPDHLTDAFGKVLKRNGLKHIRLHDLRHSCASIMLANGVQMKQIQEWLGHSNYSTTADVYSHLDFSSKLQSAEKISEVFSFEEDKQELSEREILQKIEELKAKLKSKTVD